MYEWVVWSKVKRRRRAWMFVRAMAMQFVIWCAQCSVCSMSETKLFFGDARGPHLFLQVPLSTFLSTFPRLPMYCSCLLTLVDTTPLLLDSPSIYYYGIKEKMSGGGEGGVMVVTSVYVFYETD